MFINSSKCEEIVAAYKEAYKKWKNVPFSFESTELN